MIEVSLYESDVEVLKSIAHGNALFSGGAGDWDPKVGLSLLIERWNEQDDEIERLQKRVKELEESIQQAFSGTKKHEKDIEAGQ